jgi:hypothetical protein
VRLERSVDRPSMIVTGCGRPNRVAAAVPHSAPKTGRAAVRLVLIKVRSEEGPWKEVVRRFDEILQEPSGLTRYGLSGWSTDQSGGDHKTASSSLRKETLQRQGARKARVGYSAIGPLGDNKKRRPVSHDAGRAPFRAECHRSSAVKCWPLTRAPVGRRRAVMVGSLMFGMRRLAIGRTGRISRGRRNGPGAHRAALRHCRPQARRAVPARPGRCRYRIGRCRRGAPRYE